MEGGSDLGFKSDIFTMNCVCLIKVALFELAEPTVHLLTLQDLCGTSTKVVEILAERRREVLCFCNFGDSMPRDNKAPLIQKIAKQAYTTFRGLQSSANGDVKVVEDKLNGLISLVTAVRASDVKIAPRKTNSSSGAAELQSPPVTYMHICETEVFSMGVFLLRSGASIPLHDHPGMNGMLKVFTPLCSANAI